MSYLSDQTELLHATLQPVEDATSRAYAVAFAADEVRELAAAYGAHVQTTAALAELTREVADRLPRVHADVDDMLGLVAAWQHGGRYTPGVASGTTTGIGGGGTVEANLTALIDELTALRSTLDDADCLAADALAQGREVADFAVSFSGRDLDAELGRTLIETLEHVVAELDAVGSQIDEAIGLAETARGSPAAGTGTSSAAVAASAPLTQPRNLAARDRPAGEVDAVCRRQGIDDPQEQAAVYRGYAVAHEHTAPFVVSVVDDMLTDLRGDLAANPGARVVFVGRDGHSLAVACRRLGPELMRQHASEVVLSRAVVEAAVQDLERNAGQSFPEIADFRRAAGKVDPAEVAGARQRLTEYLHRNGVPVGRPGSEVILVDTSYKGTVQELLSATYPATRFTGRYAFYGASPYDPHPGTKTGYALHLDAAASSGGRPVEQLPDDLALTFSHQDAIACIEETLHGPLSSPTRMTSRGPAQQPARTESAPLAGLNPALVSQSYHNPRVREAVLDCGLIAVADVADHAAATRSARRDYRADLHVARDRFVGQVRAWITGSPTDAQFAEVMNSFVRRADRGAVGDLATALDRAGLDEPARRGTWEAFSKLVSLAARRDFVRQFQQRHRSSE